MTTISLKQLIRILILIGGCGALIFGYLMFKFNSVLESLGFGSHILPHFWWYTELGFVSLSFASFFR